MRFHISELIFVAGFIVYIVIRGVFEHRSKAASRVVKTVDRGEMLLIIVVAIGTMIVPILYLATPWLTIADYTLPQAAPFAGTGIMQAALWLFWRSHADLALNWSRTLEIRESHSLVTHGLYSSIRHPMYAAIWLFSLAQGLLLHNWLAGWSALAAFGVMYFFRIGNEERMMAEHFGPEYRDYASRTGRLFPRIRR